MCGKYLKIALLDSMTEFVEIIPWITSDGLINEIEDQLTSVDDCLHRFKEKIILFIDIDIMIDNGIKFLVYQKFIDKNRCKTHKYIFKYDVTPIKLTVKTIID
jgi:hypothetical protein